MAEAEASATVCATVVMARAPRRVEQFEVQLERGATVAHALRRCGLERELALLEAERLGVAIWGRRATSSQRVEPGDRLELCRPLVVDPKAARRKRFEQQGRRASGLFAAGRGARP